MALEVASGKFDFPSSTGWFDVVTTLSFTPKFVKIWVIGREASGAGFTNHNRGTIGLADGTNVRSLQWIDRNADSEGDSHTRWSSQHVLWAFDSSGGTAADFKATSLDFVPSTGTGFRINVTDGSATNVQVFWEAYGGSDIEEIKVGDFETDDTLSTQDVTDPGISDLDGVLFFSPLTNGIADTRLDDAKCCIGFTDFTDNYYVNFTINDDDTTSQAHSAQGNDGCIADSNPEGGGILSRSQCKTKIANGFRLDHDDRWEFGDIRVFYVAIKGPKFKAIKVDSRTTNGTITTTGVGFRPKAIDMMSISHSLYETAVNNAQLNYGCTVDDPGSHDEHCASCTSEDSQATTDTGSRSNDQDVHQMVDKETAVECTINMTSYDSDGWTMEQSNSSGANVDFIMCFCWGVVTGHPYYYRTGFNSQ